MAISLESFVKHVKPHVTACPEPIIIDAIRTACIRFCTDTWLIRENLPPNNSYVDVDDYTMIASTDNECLGVVSFLYDKRELHKTTTEELDVLDAGWRTADPGTPTAIIAPEPDRVILNRVPDRTIIDGLIVEIAVRPTDPSLSVNNKLYNDWREAIKYGALSKLTEIPDKSWSDMKQSLWYGKEFNFQIQRGKSAAVKGNMKKSTSVRYRAWV